ncbi:hypothetical protein [Legionella sp. CNM-4043-24]|uniref:hypothetical protein n=1 Tax=Legionella sp. CNM-4043-24 TaxID=3421646 RepID=UPI00403AA611
MIVDRTIVTPGTDITDGLTEFNVQERAGAISTYIEQARTHLQTLVDDLCTQLDAYPDSEVFRVGEGSVRPEASSSSSSSRDDFQSPVDFSASPSNFLRKAYTVQVFNGDQNRYQYYINAGFDFGNYCEHNRDRLTVQQRLFFDASKLVSAAHNQISTLNRIENRLNIIASASTSDRKRDEELNYLPLDIQASLPNQIAVLLSSADESLLMSASPEQIASMLDGKGRVFEWINANPEASDDAYICALILSSCGEEIFNRHQSLLLNREFISNFALLARNKNNLPVLRNMLNISETEDLPQMFLMTKELYFLTPADAIALATQRNRFELSQLLFDEDLRQTAIFLTRHDIESNTINLNSLSPGFCRVMNRLETFLEPYGEDYNKDYMREVLRGVMDYFNGQCDLMECLHRTLPVSNQEPVDDNAALLASGLSTLLYQMLSVHQAARELNEPLDSLRYDNQRLAWLGRALHLLAYPPLPVQQELFSYVGQRNADILQDDTVMHGTMSALRAIREQGVSKEVICLDHLLTNPLLRTHAAPLTEKLLTLEHHGDRVHHFHCLLPLAATRFDLELILDAITETHNHQQLRARVSQLAPAQREEARHLTDVVDMTLQLSNLGFGPEVISRFVSEPRFQQAMRGVEIKCRNIREYLGTHSRQKLEAFNACIRQYRIDLYTAIDRELTRGENEPSSFNEDIEEAQAPLRQALEEDRHPWLRQSLKLITNFLAIVFTLGYANRKHEAKTGDYAFFARPESAKKLRMMDKEVIQTINPPAA